MRFFAALLSTILAAGMLASPAPAPTLRTTRSSHFHSLSGERLGFAVQRTRVLRQQISHLLPSTSSKNTA
jgi:hypothetical protein